MTIHRILTGTVALLATSALAAAEAQQAQTPTAAAQPASMTLVGCLYEEKAVPGREPNVAEQAGLLEDYILAEATMKGSGTGSEAVGTAGTAPAHGNMYKVEHVDDELLSTLVGKRVEVTGRVDAEASAAPHAPSGEPGLDRSAGPDEIELPEFEAASIREVSGTCPATPASAR